MVCSFSPVLTAENTKDQNVSAFTWCFMCKCTVDSVDYFLEHQERLFNSLDLSLGQHQEGLFDCLNHRWDSTKKGVFNCLDRRWGGVLTARNLRKQRITQVNCLLVLHVKCATSCYIAIGNTAVVGVSN